MIDHAVLQKAHDARDLLLVDMGNGVERFVLPIGELPSHLGGRWLLLIESPTTIPRLDELTPSMQVIPFDISSPLAPISGSLFQRDTHTISEMAEVIGLAMVRSLPLEISYQKLDKGLPVIGSYKLHSLYPCPKVGFGATKDTGEKRTLKLGSILGIQLAAPL